MIMSNRRSGFIEETSWERFINDAKIWIYSVLYEIIGMNFASIILFKIFILVETLQLLYFSIHSKFDFLWNTDFFLYFRQVIQYVQINSLLDKGNQVIHLSILYLSFFINLIMITIFIIAVYQVKNRTKKRSSGGSLLGYFFKLLSLFAILINTILTIPFFNIFLATIICNQGSSIHQEFECYSGSYIGHMIVAIFGLIILVIFCGLFNLFLIDLNPFSKAPFAAPQNKVNFAKTILKFLLPLYTTIDSDMSISKAFVIILMLYHVIFLIQRFQQIAFYNRSLLTFVTMCEITLFWVSLSVVLHALLDTTPVDNIGLFYTVLAIPFFMKVYQNILQEKQWQYLQKNPLEFKKPDKTEMYIDIVIDLIEHREKLEKKIKLEGLLRYHAESCNQQTEHCPCQQMVIKDKKDEDQSNQESQWYMFIRGVILETLEKFPKSSKLHLINAYLHNEKLQNTFKALTEMMVAEDIKPTIQEEFSLYRYKQIIELKIIEADMRNEQHKTVDVNATVHFENQYVTFSKAIEKSVEMHLEFWRELLDDNPDIQKLQILGSKITSTIEDVELQFKRLCDINPNNIRSLQNYGFFLKEVVNDDMEVQRILEKAEYVKKSTVVNKQFIDNERLKYSENSNTGILLMSGNLHTRNYVTNINYDMTRILGFSKHELVDQNIKNRIMPRQISLIHDDLVGEYLQTSQPKAIGTERFVTPNNSDGFLVPSILMIKVLPSLDDGLQFVGFVKEKEEYYCKPYKRQEEDEIINHYIIYKYEQNMTVVGITQSIYEYFGIPVSLVNGNSPMSNQFTMDLICPAILDPQVQDDMKSDRGAQVIIDTTIIEQQFLISNEKDEEEYSNLMNKNNENQNIEEPNNKEGEASDNDQKGIAIGKQQQQKYKKAEVVMHLVEAFEYKSTILHIIKFVEVQEGIDFKEGDLVKLDQNMDKLGEQQQNEENNEEDEDENNEAEEFGMNQEDFQDKQDDQDKESNKSGGSGANEELRQLKDIKAAIQEKTVPKSILLLKRTVFILFIILSVLTGVELSLKLSQSEALQEGFNANHWSYLRHTSMADVNFMSRQLYLLSNDYLTSSANATIKQQVGTNYQQLLSGYVNTVQEIHYSVIKSLILLNQRDSSVQTQMATKFTVLLQNSQIQNYTYNFSDGIMQYITDASALTNSSIDSFQSSLSNSSYSNPTKMNFFFVRENGLFNLRFGSEQIAQIVYNFYQDYLDILRNNFLIIMLLALSFVILSQVILIPIVFSVHKTNTKVISLFALVPIDEIQDLSYRCELYMKNFMELKEGKLQQEDEFSKINNGSAIQQKGQQAPSSQQQNMKDQNAKGNYLELNNDTKQKGSSDQKNSPNQQYKFKTPQVQKKESNKEQSNTLMAYSGNQHQEKNTLEPGSNNNNLKKPERKLSQHLNTPTPEVEIQVDPPPSSQRTDAMNQKQQNQKGGRNSKNSLKNPIQIEEEDKKEGEDDLENQRSSKLQNSKDSKRKIVIFQFCLLASLYLSYFIVTFVIEVNYLNQINQILNHMRVLSMRPSLVKYKVLFTLEQIVEPNNNNNQDMIQTYQDLIYTNEELLVTTSKDNFPSAFSSYLTLFNNINFNDACKYSILQYDTRNIDKCNNVQNGILQKGLRTAIVSLNELSRDLIRSFNDSDKSQGNKTLLINSQNMLYLYDMRDFIVPAISLMKTNLQSAFSDYVSLQDIIEKIKFSMFIMVMVVVFLFIWVPYLNRLNQRIWMTKGMLNMIPMDIIIKHENLRNAFTNGDILRAVR